MFKVLIVEDEKIMREGLKRAINWGVMGFEVVATAENGKEALSKIAAGRIDVIITDVRMPVMDGIELLKVVKERYGEDIPVILLSAHEEFEYAKKGLDFGAEAYVLKLNISEEIAIAMKKVKCKLDQREKERRARAALEKHYLLQLLLDDQKNVEEKNALDFKWNCYMTAVFHFDIREGDSIYEKITFFNDCVAAYPNPLIQKISLLCIRENELTVFFFCDTSDSDVFKTCVIDLLKKMHHAVQYQKHMHNAFVGTSILYKEIGQLKKSYEEARFAATYYIMSQTEWVVQIEHFDSVKHVSVKQHLQDVEQRILLSIQGRNVNNVKLLVNNWFSILENQKDIPLHALTESCAQLLSIVAHELGKQKDTAEEAGINKLFEKSSYKDIRDYVEQTIDQMMVRILPQNESKRRMEELLKYLNNNLEEKITLKEAADYIYLNPSYLSVVFKSYTGFSFTEYLNKIKMETAKNLIKLGLSVNETAHKVGYKDNRNFRRVFKTIHGVNPGELKE